MTAELSKNNALSFSHLRCTYGTGLNSKMSSTVGCKTKVIALSLSNDSVSVS